MFIYIERYKYIYMCIDIFLYIEILTLKSACVRIYKFKLQVNFLVKLFKISIHTKLKTVLNSHNTDFRPFLQPTISIFFKYWRKPIF